MDFVNLRKEFPEFIYRSYSVHFEEGSLKIKYLFEIPHLATFTPEWTFPSAKEEDLPRELVENLAFSLGMVELISYWKATCSPLVKVIPHGLSSEMKEWWKSLYFGGLGEFFYKNKIATDRDSFMTIETYREELKPSDTEIALSGNLIPIGGGKDSSVTLRILADEKEENLPTVINSRLATDETCEVAGYKDSTYKVRRTICPELIKLNAKGFLNGHTPFSAIVAFSSIISALINKKKFVVLSNESSANESTVLGEDINHQFSKGEDFERNFIEYEKKYINSGVLYFSLLRPLSEMQISALFSKYKEFHGVFKSCNVGSKKDIWCGECPKCLFVYTILSPFLSEGELISIFGSNLFENEALMHTYKELIGVLENKPFECVGSRDEVISASKSAVENYKKEGKELPHLLRYFDSLSLVPEKSVGEYMTYYDEKHHIPQKFEEKLKREIKELLYV